ncbi:MAG: DUF4199 domain-containing protein [Bacteroidales bacterium]|nr:DUF4199 domain-containing protein [Bacteroidales bacterium]
MENKRSVGQVSLNYGIITGVGLILLSLLLYSLGASQTSWAQWISYAIILAGMIIGALNYRKRDLEGFMSYSQAFGVTFLIGIFAAIIIGIYSYVFYEFFAPEQIEVMIRGAEEELWKSNQNLTDEQFEMAMNFTKRFMTPTWLGIIAFGSTTLVGLIMALIISIFVRKEDNSFNATFKQVK